VQRKMIEGFQGMEGQLAWAQQDREVKTWTCASGWTETEALCIFAERGGEGGSGRGVPPAGFGQCGGRCRSLKHRPESRPFMSPLACYHQAATNMAEQAKNEGMAARQVGQ
jgi:hypothetical protein